MRDYLVDDNLLAAMLKATFLRSWSNEDIVESKFMRFAQAYVMMASENYRPAAPSDGFGHIQLSKLEMQSKEALYSEAVKYAYEFNEDEDDCKFFIGCSNYTTNRAFIFCIEAARLLAGGNGGDALAVAMLKMATVEIMQNSKSKQINKFHDWLQIAKITDDAAGDLISDLKRDPASPRMFLSMREMHRFIKERGGCEGAVDAVPLVWSRFTRWLKKRPYYFPSAD